ncbi:NADP-reducing hydrogenase subunit HndA [uncultured delta proteobacterium]|uniref:NADP-reducing hydrogenase subunit HndA n=1 Tax=uncultured delta proteobacterium TaxID=34034 RepID=A0A212JB03_9DELT|nr:NADP-reducing hydrogenase subunit HndA [uncultured delta proteobacterium]
MPNEHLPASGFAALEKFIDQLEDKESSLIRVLYEAQHIFGYLPKEVMLFVAEKLHVAASKIYGVVSFYSFFTTKPKGKCQIRVCLGTACFVCGGERIAREVQDQLDLKMGETSPDRAFSLEAVRCVGACGLAPAVLINDAVHAKVRPDDVATIISKHRK